VVPFFFLPCTIHTRRGFLREVRLLFRDCPLTARRWDVLFYNIAYRLTCIKHLIIVLNKHRCSHLFFNFSYPLDAFEIQWLSSSKASLIPFSLYMIDHALVPLAIGSLAYSCHRFCYGGWTGFPGFLRCKDLWRPLSKL
jgi:hypothetical protein